MPRHPDFEKIYRAFMKRYCGSPDNECEKGKRVYYAWLKKLGLDDTKPYRRPQEAFTWADYLPRLVKQDREAKYYKALAVCAISSMNNVIYTEDELIKACRSLIGKPVNLNHETPPIEGVEIIDADYEDEGVEVLIRVPRNVEVEVHSGFRRKLVELLDQGEVVHVSIEGYCKRGFRLEDEGAACQGLVFTGLALLTRDVLPGVPLTFIEPVEKIVEKFQMETEKIEEREWTTAFINSLPDAAFAVIEPAYKRGETEDKRCRHLPHHGPDVKTGKEHNTVDLPHLRNALARMNQIKPVTDSISVEELRRRARVHLTAHAKALLGEELTFTEDGEEDLETEEKREEKVEENEAVQKPCECEEEKTEEQPAEESETTETTEETEEPQTSTEEKLEALEKRVETLAETIAKLEQALQAKQELEEAAEQAEETDAKPCECQEPPLWTKEGFFKRFRELRKEGLSKSEAYRLTVKEMLDALKNRGQP